MDKQKSEREAKAAKKKGGKKSIKVDRGANSYSAYDEMEDFM